MILILALIFLSKIKLLFQFTKKMILKKSMKGSIINEQFNHINYQELDKFLNENILGLKKF